METVQMQSLSDTTQHDRLWAAAAHGGALLLALLTSWSAGVAGMLAALAVYVLKKDDAGFAADHAREAFNFNLSMFLMACLLAIIGVVLVGATLLTLGIGAIVTLPAGLLLAVLAAAMAVTWLVCSVMATFKALNGETYRYPLTLRLLG